MKRDDIVGAEHCSAPTKEFPCPMTNPTPKQKRKSKKYSVSEVN